jgi:pantoate kinase
MSERPTSSRSMMTSQEVAYAKKITEHNKAILAGTSKEPLMKTFTNMASQFSEKVNLKLLCMDPLTKTNVSVENS